jgi:membrane fusion protein (multidrug efflux system)
VSKLYGSGTLSERDRDQARSTLELAQADVTVAKAAVNDARIQLDYTAVKAPISGVTSLELLSEGNLVQEQTLLTTVTQLDPIHVQFSLSERDALALRQRMRQGQPRVELMLPDGSSYDQAGHIDFADSAVDARTGKVLARAVFPNAEGALLPGQFVRVSLERASLASAIVVPKQAVAQGDSGPIVWVVNGEDVAEPRPVELGQSLDHGVVVTRGLLPGERVVTDGIANIHGAGKVRVMAPASALAESKTAADRRKQLAGVSAS